MNGVGDAMQWIKGQLEELLMVGSGWGQDASQVASWKPHAVLPRYDLTARFGSIMIVAVPISGQASSNPGQFPVGGLR